MRDIFTKLGKVAFPFYHGPESTKDVCSSRINRARRFYCTFHCSARQPYPDKAVRLAPRRKVTEKVKGYVEQQVQYKEQGLGSELHAESDWCTGPEERAAWPDLEKTHAAQLLTESTTCHLVEIPWICEETGTGKKWQALGITTPRKEQLINCMCQRFVWNLYDS